MSASKTMLKRIEQYNDRWSSLGLNTGIAAVSDKLTADQLRRHEIFKPYSDRFLEKISPDVSVAVWKKGALLFEEGAYIDLAFFIARGEVDISLRGAKEDSIAPPIFSAADKEEAASTLTTNPGNQTMVLDLAKIAVNNTLDNRKKIAFLATMDVNLAAQSSARLGPGDFFGEIGTLSGWPQSVTARTAAQCELVQIRLPALRLMKTKSDDLKLRLDDLYRKRSLLNQLKTTPLFAKCSQAFLEKLAREAALVSLEPGESLAREGEPADALYLVRSGFIKLMQRFGSGELAISYLSKGMTVGETEFLTGGPKGWLSTAISVEYAELVKIPASIAGELLAQDPSVEARLWRNAGDRVKDASLCRRDPGKSEFIQTALDTGLVQGSSVLAIDLETCTRCDDCVRACAAVHQGRPRFVREGSKVDHLMLAKSCYHCRDPVCLVGCPTGAIHRAGVAEVVKIDGDICIGCSTCANNCPYDAIVMHDMGETWPDDMTPVGLRGLARQQASKCDLCCDAGHPPACVSNCPQGSAQRADSIESFRDLLRPAAAAPSTAKRRLPKASPWFWGFAATAALSGILYLIGSVWTNPWQSQAYGVAAVFFLIATAAYAARRRIMKLASKWRLGRSQTWLQAHLYGGALFMLMVLMHTGFRFPSGTFNQWLWGLSVWTVVSGLIGMALQKSIPRMLASGLAAEAIYERIPSLIERLRGQAESLAAACGEPVRAFYDKNLASSMVGVNPRWIYFFDITGGVQSRARGFRYLRDFLADGERAKLDELEKVYKTKLELDAQYTLQQTLRWWLYAHAPPALLLVALTMIHLFTVFYY